MRAMTCAWATLVLIGCNGLLGCNAEADVTVSTSTGSGIREPAQPQTALAGTITFVSPSGSGRVVTVQELHESFEPVTFSAEDSNYSGKQTFVAVSLERVLRKYLEEETLESASKVQLIASDGYTVETDLKTLLSPDAFLALGNRKPGEFEPIGDRKADPRPLYLVWRGEKNRDEKKYPRPWSLVRVELLDSSDRHAHTRPKGGFADNKKALKGYELFSASCIRCHSINQEGGKVGPDLNVPQNILGYRPEAQVRAYIKNPAAFRYSTMPAHPQFSESDLDALVEYLKVMGEHQFDPNQK